MDILFRLFKVCFISFGVMLFVIISVDIIKNIKKSKSNKDRVYLLCERYINLYNNGDGYWLTDTEMQLYEELEDRLLMVEECSVNNKEG